MKRNLTEVTGCLRIIFVLITIFPAFVFARPPSPPISIVATLEELKGSLSDGLIGYVVQLEQREESRNLRLEAHLTSVDPSRIDQKRNSVFRKEFQSGEKAELNIPIRIGGPGLYLLEISVRGEIDDDNGFSNDIHRYVIIDKNSNYRIISPQKFVGEQRRMREKRFYGALKKNPDSPDLGLLNEDTLSLPAEIGNSIRRFDQKNQINVRPSGPSANVLKYVEQKSDEAWSSEDPITVRGRLTYRDFDNVWRPLVNVSVNIYDEDVGFDDHLGTVATDWNGDWSFSVNNNDGWLADGRDIYYTFKLENTRIRVQDCDGIDSTYRWQSATHDNRSEGSVLDYGTETGSTNRNSMQIWNMLNLAWNGAVTMGGRDPGFVDSCYPEDGGSLWSRFWEEIDVNSADNDAPDVVTHEYGHAIMYYAYGSDNPSPGGAHGFGDNAQDPSLSWSEGWATGFMLALRPDGRYNWSEGDTGRNIENFSDAGNRDGNRNEGRVAAAINDMIDNANDDNGGDLDRGRDDADDDNTPNRVSLSTMLNDTLWGGWHDDFEEFWASLSGELAGAMLGDANEIMFYNYMDVPAPITCVATKITALESNKPESVLDGLRRFRDHALKGFNGGQHLINTYYRNSPELAWMLIKDARLRKDAIRVINHFSELGYTMTENSRFRKLADSRRPVIDRKMAQRIRSMIDRIEQQASAELKNDMEPLGRILASVEGLDARGLQDKLEDVKSKHPKVHQNQLRQSTLNDASRKAIESDEVKSMIRKYVPPFDG